MRDLMTSLLDVLALLLVAAGAGAGSARWIGWWGVAVAGLVVFTGSQVAHRLGGPEAAPGDGE